MLSVKDCDIKAIKAFLLRLDLKLTIVDDKTKIPGSFWGDDEAGLIQNVVYVNPNTPIHSLLHETCHYICMDEQRRQALNTNAGGDYDEENAVCYLQIIISDQIKEMDQSRMFKDMDDWGYTFRLGSSQKWFEEDADDARDWLLENSLIDQHNQFTFCLKL